MENESIILNVDSDNRKIEINLLKESTILDIISDLIDKKEEIMDSANEIINTENTNFEVNLVYIEIKGKISWNCLQKILRQRLRKQADLQSLSL